MNVVEYQLPSVDRTSIFVYDPQADGCLTFRGRKFKVLYKDTEIKDAEILRKVTKIMNLHADLEAITQVIQERESKSTMNDSRIRITIGARHIFLYKGNAGRDSSVEVNITQQQDTKKRTEFKVRNARLMIFMHARKLLLGENNSNWKKADFVVQLGEKKNSIQDNIMKIIQSAVSHSLIELPWEKLFSSDFDVRQDALPELRSVCGSKEIKYIKAEINSLRKLAASCEDDLLQAQHNGKEEKKTEIAAQQFSMLASLYALESLYKALRVKAE